jgi:3-methyladenine DNA glycosylase/8-oxoguanine DNA glycosylase
MKFPKSIQALRHLKKSDPRLGAIITQVGPIRIELDPNESIFESLTTSIIYQQLHGKAAAAILARVKNLWNPHSFPTPEQVLYQSEDSLRSTGLSRTKILSMQDLSKKILDGSLPSREQASKLNDEELLNTLIQVRGIGPWTAQMFLIFTLGRTDVLPVGDFGVRRGFAAVYGKRKMPTPEQLESAAEAWRPYRSAASWYLWQALELEKFKKIKIQK